MDPAPPTTHVWHPYHGDRVVVAAPLPAAEVQAQQLETMHGPGTWTISLDAHNRSLRNMDGQGVAKVTPDDFRWAPWSELKEKNGN